MFANPHEAFSIVAKDVRDAAGTIQESWATQNSDSSFIVGGAKYRSGDRSSHFRIKKKLDDYERDQYLEASYEYIAHYFDGYLQELAARNPHIKIRFKRVDKTSSSSYIYDNGERVSECSVYYGNSGCGSSGIAFSHA
jgi:hypothetical protein